MKKEKIVVTPIFIATTAGTTFEGKGPTEGEATAEFDKKVNDTLNIGKGNVQSLEHGKKLMDTVEVKPIEKAEPEQPTK